MVKIFHHVCLREARTGVDQGMRDGKGVHTIRDSYCHGEMGVEET